MSRLILVKHAMPQIDPAVPAKDWRLSDQGWGAATTLAHKLKGFGPGRVVASPEPKATDTGHVIAEAIGWPFEVEPAFAEHSRATVKFGTQAEVEASIRRLFEEPDRLVYGEETADQAHARFAEAIERHLAASSGTLLAACHGTVITLWVSRRYGLDPMPFWKSLALPSAVVIEDGAPPRLIA
ncbi:MAG TPA: histidine phosphatase family protein [Caulobacteraceae bacterium]|nr:histidine phosphatase family protein [Caulobacteraceae bacterium]